MSYDNVRLLQLGIVDNSFLLSSRGQLNATALYWLDEYTFGAGQINVWVLAGPDVGQVYSGIYRTDGSILLMCLAPSGSPRPIDFSTAPDSGQILYVWIQAQRRQTALWP